MLQPVWASAELRPTSSPNCVDLLLVFARGSSQNQEDELVDDPLNPDFENLEKESYSFFNWFKTHLDVEYPHVDYKAVSIHDFSGKYDPVGYKAAAVGFPGQIANSANAETSWIPGHYRDSVDHGISETVGYLKDQIASCPNQSIAVGGYSQGAQVMGESLFQLSAQERSKIVGVGLFGDPKFIASTDDPLNPFDKATSYPWRRGDATNKDRGMLDARIPYVPDDMEKRVASYCLQSDLVCSGWSGLRGIKDVAHGGYSGEPMRNTVNEMMQWAAPNLSAYEREHGGLGSGEGTQYAQGDNKPRDIMFVVNDDSNQSVLQTLRYYLDQTLYPVATKYPNTIYAAKAVGESDDGLLNVPRIENIQSFSPYIGYDVTQPMFSVSNLASTINKRYPFAQPYYGSGDYPNPLGLAVEKGVFSPGWREDSTRHLVLFTDRPLKESYSFNICHDTTRTRLQIPHATYNVCAQDFGTDTWPKTQQPEVCETIYLAITQDSCTNPIKTSGSTQMINRTLDDEITAAQTQKVAVDVVVPFNTLSRYGGQADYDTNMKKLEYLAKATGGKFINYDKANQYNQALFSDTLYQIFGHTPKPLVLAYKDALDSLHGFNSGAVLGASTDRPIILDASQSNQTFNNYRWDFNNDGQWDETSSGPVIEHHFTCPTAGFVRVAGTDANNITQAETRIAVSVTQTDHTPATTLPNVPDITEQTAQNGDITLKWQSNSEGILLVIDPVSHLPLAQSPLDMGTLTFTPDQSYSELEVRVMTEDATSDPQTINIAPVPLPTTEPIPTEEPPVSDVGSPPDLQQAPDPTLCYKLQQCQDESDPTATITPQLQPETITARSSSTLTLNNTPRPAAQTITTKPTEQQAVLGTTSSPSLTPTPEASALDEAMKQATPTKKDYKLQWIGMTIFIFGGSLLLYRIVKMR